MSARKHRKPAPPLNPERLQQLALRYVGRYSTSRSKLRAYLARKVRERGWDGSGEPPLNELVKRFAELHYVDDAAFALSKAQSLSGRGYGKRRLVEKLRVAGIEEEDSQIARRHADAEALSAALRFAERRRIGPYASASAEPRERDRAIAAMIRTGHPFALARAIAAMPPGSEIDIDELSERFRSTDA
jgi:regulatory protein